MSHKIPGKDIWELSRRSKQLWEILVERIHLLGMDPLKVLGWKKTGSLLIGRTLEDLDMLEERVKMLSDAGLRAEYLSATTLHLKEPALEVGKEGGAAFVPDDCQLDAHHTVAFLEKGNRSFASEGRYAEFYHNPAISLLRSDRSGEVEAIRTSNNFLYSRKAVIIAAGAWSGSLMRNLVMESDIELDVPVQPRKGHLLVLENFSQFRLNHGLMELGYVNHEISAPVPSSSASGAIEHENSASSISMTAMTDVMGNLVLGSSRQFTGFNTETEDAIVNRIWERAGEFFPSIKEQSLLNFSRGKKVRIGLRPYMPDGKPLIGPVPGLPKLFLATGHEGGGLCMALGTAEMVADMVLGNTGKVDCTPFSIQGRCCS
ncbi:FAD-dependent oxidoreductase family protein isoform X2 [Tasmannia lanceolata]